MKNNQDIAYIRRHKDEHSMDTAQWLLSREIFHTHDDAEVGHVLVVGFDERRDLVIMLGRYQDATSKEKVLRQVVVRKEDAFRMAQQLRISMTGLPNYIADKFSIAEGFSGMEQGESILADILDYLLSLKVSYKVD